MNPPIYNLTKFKNHDINNLALAYLKKAKRLKHLCELPEGAAKQLIKGYNKKYPHLDKTFIQENLEFFKQDFIEKSTERKAAGFKFNHKNVFSNLSALDITLEIINAISYTPVKEFLTDIKKHTPIEGFLLAGVESYFNIHYNSTTPVKETEFVMQIANDLIKSYEVFKYDTLLSTKQRQLNILNAIEKQKGLDSKTQKKKQKLEDSVKKLKTKNNSKILSYEDTLHLGQQLLDWLIQANLVNSELVFLKTNSRKPREAYIIQPTTALWTVVTKSWSKTENLPLICKPNPWALLKEGQGPDEEVTTNAYGGGLLRNENDNQNFPLVIQRQHPYIKDPENKQKLIRRTPDAGITTYVSTKSVEIINSMQTIPFKINTELLNYILQNLTKFFEYHSLTIHKFEDASTYVIHQRKTSDKINHANSYKEELNKIRYFIDCLVTAYVYENKTIFFMKALDFRGRIYDRGYPLSPQGDQLAKSLLLIKTSAASEAPDISLDVTASGFQMLGLLLGDEKLLEQTKFLKSEQKQDLYEEFLAALLEHHFPDLTDTKTKFSPNKEAKIIDRPLIKNIIMCHSYNETLYGLIEKLKERPYFDDDLKEYKLTIREFATKTKQFIEQQQPLITAFSLIMEKMVKLNANKPFGFNRSFYNHTTVYYTKESKVRIPSKIPKKIKKRTTLIVEDSPVIVNLRKAIRAMIPNYVHALDSVILMKTIEILIKQNIPLTTSHDSIRTKAEFSGHVKKAYINSCVEIFLLSDAYPLQELTRLHEVTDTEILDFTNLVNQNLDKLKERILKEENLNYEKVLSLETDKFITSSILKTYKKKRNTLTSVSPIGR